jgi:hypothetical protein
MTGKQYVVHTVRDEPVRLRDQLDHIAAEGGRVVSVIWQPARQHNRCNGASVALAIQVLLRLRMSSSSCHEKNDITYFDPA